MIKIFNTKTNRLESFKSIEENKVNMYVCGPTVYDHAHIGNARPIVVFDTLKKLLEAKGYEVTYVSNYTDIDDKIIDKAIKEKSSELDVANQYINAYEEVRALYHASNPDKMPRVTQTMPQIEQLIEQCAAYETEGNVYFDVNSVKDYGHLSHQNIEELQVGSRIEENVEKKSPLDFVIWKKTIQGISWESPWSKGRPGWHTECVVMIHDEFKNHTIDIHGGGQDLKFPHHENENAQNCALHNEGLANYWMHNAMVDIDNQKMSKSLGNVVWAKDFVYELGSNVARWLLIQNHYRQSISITDEVIAQSQKEIERLESALKAASLECQLLDVHDDSKDDALFERYLEALSDDLNTPNAIMVLFEGVKQINQLLRQRDKDVHTLRQVLNSVIEMASILGIEFDLILADEQLDLVRTWQKAKADKDFDLADTLREQLITQGVL